MAGLLGGPQIDGTTLGLLGLSQGLLTPRQQGGGIGAGMQGLAGGLLQGQQMQRQAQQDELRTRMFGLQEKELQVKLAEAQRKQDFINSLPPELRQVAQLDPSVAAKTLAPQKAENPFAKVDPKDYTQESVARFSQSGNFADLVPVRKMDTVNGQVVDLTKATPGTVIPPQMPWEYEMGPNGDARMRPGVFTDKARLARAGATNVNTPVQILQEREESKTVGKFFGDMYADLQKAGMQAQGKVNNLNRLDQLLEGTSTGKLTPAATTLAAYADSVGIKIDPKLGDKQALESLSNELALQARNPSGGAGMPGAMSDADREFLRNIVPNLSKTPEGNRQIVDTMRKLAQRDRDVARLATEYRRKNGTLDDGFATTLQQFSDANPMFPKAPAQVAPNGRSVSGTVGGAPSNGWSIKKVP